MVAGPLLSPSCDNHGMDEVQRALVIVATEVGRAYDAHGHRNMEGFASRHKQLLADMLHISEIVYFTDIREPTEEELSAAKVLTERYS